MKNYLRNIYHLSLFLPLLIYFGKRSLIAFDEGFYVLQAKWIIQNNNWIAPLWWGELSLDRTIGIQYCIALSQQLFGDNNVANILPVTFGGIIMLISTYSLHKELIGKKFAIISPLILSTTALWVNYVHMATQDIIFSALISIGILSSIKSARKNSNFYFFFSGIWLGLAVMMKTYLAFIPFLGILPILLKSKTFQNKYYWLGIILGFAPFILWSISIIKIYNIEDYLGLHNKLLFLSKNNIFTNPFYYYLWNLPLNIFPWSIFAILGIIVSKDFKDNYTKYILFKYPIIVLILLSLFSTKTPYYPIQLLSILSINSYLGLVTLLNNNNNIIIFFKNLLFKFLPIILFILSILSFSIMLNLDISYLQKLFIAFGIISFSIGWFSINFAKTIKSKLIFAIAGAYALTICIVQSGLISDRSKELRMTGEQLVKKEFLKDKKIEVIKNELGDQKSVAKIIKISTLMPKIGNGVEKLEDLKNNQYAWTTSNREFIIRNNKYLLVNDSEIFYPWKLIKKVN